MREIGAFEQVILLALARCGGEADGARVRAEIEGRTGRAVAPGAVFTAMDRLEGRGLVSSRMSEKQRVRGGKRRKVYLLETEGAAALAEGVLWLVRLEPPGSSNVTLLRADLEARLVSAWRLGLPAPPTALAAIGDTLALAADRDLWVLPAPSSSVGGPCSVVGFRSRS